MSDMWAPPDQGNYTTDPYQQDALLNYLLSLDKGGLSQMRSALTGVGTDLSNQGKILGIQNKMYDNTGDLMKLAMNPAVGQMSGAFDPMALAQQQQMGGDPNQMVPFQATDFSPIRQQWQTSNTPAAQAVLAMFDQIDQGQDPTTLVQQFAAKNGGSLDVPDEATGLTGKQLLNYGSAYWNEATKRQAAQAQFQYKQANTPQQIPGMEGMDPTLGSFTEPFVQPAIGDTLVGNEVQRQQDMQGQKEAMIRNLAGVQATGDSHLGSLLGAAQHYQMPTNDGTQGIPGLGNAISRFFQNGMRGGGSDTTAPQGRYTGGGIQAALGGASRAVTSASKAAPRRSGPAPATAAQKQESNTYVSGRLSGLEDKERARLGLKPRSTGQSVGQHNLDARLRYLGGQPYPG